MNFFIPALDMTVAQAVPRAVWNVAHPNYVGTTEFAFGWSVHKDGEAFGIYMNIPSDLTIKIAADADEHEFDPILSQFVTMGLIDQSDVDRVVNTINNRRGKDVPVLTFFPSFWLDLMKTREDLVEEGFFDDV